MIVSGLESRLKRSFFLLLLLSLSLFLDHTRNLECSRNQYGRQGVFRTLSVSKFLLLVRAVIRDRREFEGKKTALYLGTFARAAHYAWLRAF